MPKISSNVNILFQLQLCQATNNDNVYKILNAYSQEELGTENLTKKERFYIKRISNNLMETELKFIGQINDIIFVKHVGLINNEIHIQDYKVTFDETQNVVNLNKPILNEIFRFTFLVGKKGRFNDYSLCTFVGKTENQYKSLADYLITFTSVTSNIIIHYIEFRTFNYKEGDEFDLLVYAVQVNNSKLEFLYDIITGKIGKIQEIQKIEGFIEGKPDYVTQLFINNISSNYLYYDFVKNPIGFVASLNIRKENEKEEGIRITKVGCIFVSNSSNDEDMIRSINDALNSGINLCIGDSQKNTYNFNALINANELKSGNGNRILVIQVMYEIGEDEINQEKF